MFKYESIIRKNINYYYYFILKIITGQFLRFFFFYSIVFAILESEELVNFPSDYFLIILVVLIILFLYSKYKLIYFDEKFEKVDDKLFSEICKIFYESNDEKDKESNELKFEDTNIFTRLKIIFTTLSYSSNIYINPVLKILYFLNSISGIFAFISMIGAMLAFIGLLLFLFYAIINLIIQTFI